MPWGKGTSGNTKGRPKSGQAVSELIRKLLAQKGDDGKPHREVIARKLIAMAEAGDLDAIKVVLDRADGKVPEQRELTGKDGGDIRGDIRIMVLYDDGTPGSSAAAP